MRDRRAAVSDRVARIIALGALWIGSGWACDGTTERIAVRFPDAETRAATTGLTVTTFEPFIQEPGEALRFVGCDAVGVFRPSAEIGIENLAAQPGLGRVFRFRDRLSFDRSFEESLTLASPGTSAANPFGAVAVLIEAQGEVSTEEGPRERPLASGCFCIRTEDRSSPDARLNREVQDACALTEPGSSRERTIDLQPLVPASFRLEPCDTGRLAGPSTGMLSPAPAACVRTAICPDGPARPDCFACRDRTCDELADRSQVPVRFEVRGGGVGPSPQLTTTDASGVARAAIDLSNCSGEFEVSARVLGRPSAETRFAGRCVEPVGTLECAGEITLGAPTRAISRLPAQEGQPEPVVVLSETDPDVDPLGSQIRVFDVENGGLLAEATIPGELPEAVYGYGLGGPSDPSVLAVATTALSSAVIVRVFEWSSNALTVTATLSEPCRRGFCGSLGACASGCPANEVCLDEANVCVLQEDGDPACVEDCGCQLRLRRTDRSAFRVTLTSADLDGDGLSDLAAGSSGSRPITVWYAQRGQGAAPYTEAACRCGRYGVDPVDLALPNLGPGPASTGGPSPDLLLAGGSGSYLTYARSSAVGGLLPCGTGARFGAVIGVRSVARGYFGCGAEDSSCFEDVAILASEETLTEPFRDSGYLRVVFGSEQDISGFPDVFDEPRTHIALHPRPSSDPSRDPRRVEVGDLNGDRRDDLFVLFAASQEVRGWLGSENGGLGELPEVLDLSQCGSSAITPGDCLPLDALVVADVDGDLREEMVVVCEPSSEQARLRWFSGGG